jgi:acyl-CoA thioesterase FadM
VLIEGSWRVRMADVDMAGVIYYGAPLRWAEMMLGDWLDRCGQSLSAMLAAGDAIPVVAAEVRYRSPLTLDDQCRLGLSARRAGRTSFTVRCSAWGPGAASAAAVAAVEVDVTHTFVSRTTGAGRVAFERQPLPPWLRKELAADDGKDEQ